ncbi:MAG: hypothetical protein OEY50_02510 [Nitrospinota bacterium]|nr:hypothetical protein [Nitrospinota bacterium]MDH5678335.1 hypothetical protein [Nitrospinota bacterium]MDH5755790.1 hypothetical protein [Nitrospinota bacterium]
MRTLNRRHGQGMTEYIIIVALIAIAAITVFTLFGDVVRGQVGNMTQELAGEKASVTVSDKATKAGTADAQKKTLKDFKSAN